MHVVFTCPRALLFLLGVTVTTRPGRRDPMTAAMNAVYELGAPVTQRRDRVAIELADPVDAVLAFRALQRALPEYEMRIVTIVASEAALEMIANDAGPVRIAWEWLRNDIEPALFATRDTLEETPRGLCAIARLHQRTSWREVTRPHPLMPCMPPAAIADQQLPDGVVVWSVDAPEPIVIVDRSPFEIAPKVQLERDGETWYVRDLGSEQGLYVNGQFAADRELLQPGTVLHFSEAMHVILAV